MIGECGGHGLPPHLKELEEGVQLKKSWLIWRGYPSSTFTWTGSNFQ